MGKRNRIVLVLLIAATIIAGVLASFGLPFFAEGTPEVHLPDLSQEPGVGETYDQSVEDRHNFVPVTITPGTVQDVIATLLRPQSYERNITFESFWSQNGIMQGAAGTVQVWADGDFLKTTTLLADGTLQNDLLANQIHYLWYGSDTRWVEVPRGERTSDLLQRTPTYEDILNKDKKDITAAGYERKNEKDCIYVEVREDTLFYLERYWVEVNSGLLVAAETVKEGQVVYRMLERSNRVPITPDTVFALPNGTELHRALPPNPQ